ncbi:NADAR family protein [Flavobacterium psychrophilum]|uniref:NADAR family protein n=1 Tax=Flavobacterium psychrophilum TaxID=96345 RepID=UPI000B7C27B4|nr:NADAR family protein [Flavobacterium psychrophilum]ELY1979782.1 NADAR family protein [Flavobacterium psychrophilum]MCB6089649.1 NADAR family protein [Flavobacterium psychrophilum]MCB6232270.1 NADAR family protein [Flavobacterium psychrophilum]MEB3379936.1 NADAR family protein [Flavobacterium psychrophilum]SNA84788.1 conserved hypothetical protein [Flavobacterium psychrophilum]
MKELTESELSNLSREDRYQYYDDLNAYKWSVKTYEAKDIDIKSSQEFYANRRGIEGITIEEELDAVTNPKKGNEKFTFFWITKSPFSQWHKSKFFATSCLNEGISDLYEVKRKHILDDLFPYDNQEYTSTEQFMMYHKAMIFLDREIAQQIMKTDDVRKIKELGRQVKNYNEYVWKYFRSKVVYEGNKAKFTQNEELKQALFATKGTTLVEAAPNDIIWGIGLAEDDPRALKRKTWLGKNLLGEILTQIRTELMGEY